MSEIIYFRADKQLAAPTGLQASSSEPADPHDPRRTITITIQVLGDGTAGDSLPLAIGSGEARGAILYFDADFLPIPVDEQSFIHVATRKDGGLIVYVCAPQSILCTLLAKIDQPGQNFRSLELLFFDYQLTPAEGLLAPSLSRANGQLKIPPWSSFDYAANANTPLPPAVYEAAAIVCNQTYAHIGDPNIIPNDFRVPYGVMLPQGKQNTVAYVLKAGSNTICSPVVNFIAVGQGLVMPDPEKYATYRAPEWEGGTSRQLNTYDIYPDLVLNITLVDDVREGDLYEVNIYLNGYDKNGVPMPPAPVQVYTLRAPKDARAGQQLPCAISQDKLLGYRRKDASNWGYMWADCQITSAAWLYASGWTRPWGPIKIDFF
ncbi:hypothetical protein CAL12_05310 [Bordetella genomosp. 8]|uniref:Uncharacterized protein n=1 Tax=Bordetella genomosp. 8 TaxID=1416806 RepID=A0A1W6YGR2_9BORD|nr:hypothetical protein [Bordetella genomosp. 8]ARP80305.1 hypothetical protein CAL12_05310 [Bordetella genomosp. 8]